MKFDLNEIKKNIKKSIDENFDYCIYTSGSTGDKKNISKNLKKRYAKIPIKKHKYKNFGFFYSLDSWAAVSVIMYCIKNQLSIIHLNFDDNLIKNIKRVSYLSLTPSIIKKIKYLYKDVVFKNIKEITLGGEYSNQNILDMSHYMFPNSKIKQVYSTSETGFICSSSDMLEGFSLNKFKNCTIKEGVLYVGDIRTNDLWEMKGERYYFCGRYDNSINLGGRLLSLEKIESKIANITKVDFCFCSKIKAPIIGEAISLTYCGALDERDMKKILKDNLQKYEIPILIKKVNKIELNSNFKIKRV